MLERGDFPPPEQVLKAEAPRGQAVEVRSLCFVSNKLEKCVYSEKKELTQLCGQCMLKKPFWFQMVQKGGKMGCLEIVCTLTPLYMRHALAARVVP